MMGLDKEHTEIVTECVQEVFNFLDDCVPKSKEYSHINLSLNVLTTALAMLSSRVIKKESKYIFLYRVTEILEASFKDAENES